MARLSKKIVACALISLLSCTYPILSYSSENHPLEVPDINQINPSAGKDCFKSLDSKDIENLANILYLRDRTAESLTSNGPPEFEKQLKQIDTNFPGEKKAAAYALLSMEIAKVNEARLKQSINQVLSRGQNSLNREDQNRIGDILMQAKENGVDLYPFLNLRVAKLSSSAELLKSKGAKLKPSGEWIFGDDFDFTKAEHDLRLRDALADFFPNEMKELSQVGHRHVIIGDRVVIKEWDMNHVPANEAEWHWRSADLEKHKIKTLDIIDRFTKKSEAFARLAKHNGHWITLFDAATSNDIFCGLSVQDILSPQSKVIIDLAHKFTGEKPNGWNKWDASLKEEQKLSEELDGLLQELTLHGANEETKASMRKAISGIRIKSIDEMEKGIKGMNAAATAVTFAPLAFLSAPVSIPAAGSSALITGLGWTGATLSTLALINPVAIAVRNIKEDIAKGDSLLCTTFKHGALVPVKLVNTLKWGAMGPFVGTLMPIMKPLSSAVTIDPTVAKFAIVVPFVLISGKNTYDATQYAKESAQVIVNLKVARDTALKNGNKMHAQVLEDMIRDANDEKWENVLGLARSTVGLIDAAQASIKTVSAKNIKALPEAEKLGAKKSIGAILETAIDEVGSAVSEPEFNLE